MMNIVLICPVVQIFYLLLWGISPMCGIYHLPTQLSNEGLPQASLSSFSTGQQEAFAEESTTFNVLYS